MIFNVSRLQRGLRGSFQNYDNHPQAFYRRVPPGAKWSNSMVLYRYFSFVYLSKLPRWLTMGIRLQLQDVSAKYDSSSDRSGPVCDDITSG